MTKSLNCRLMIRHRHEDQFLLFTQDDHARLSGTLAAHIGNLHFARPDPFAAVTEAIGMHDSGWPMHDREPTLNGDGLPLHVFETPVDISTPVWSESVRLACQRGDYCGLLVSLHVMALSALAHSRYADPGQRMKFARELFELNKFQQNQIEVQETLRQRLGMRTDLPLQYGLALPGTSEAEDLLLFNYQLLKAMDRVSLALLCSDQPFDSIDNVHPRPGQHPIHMRLERGKEWTLRIDPWPFDVRKIEADVKCKSIPAQKYDSPDAFREQYHGAPTKSVRVRVAQNLDQ